MGEWFSTGQNDFPRNHAVGTFVFAGASQGGHRGEQERGCWGQDGTRELARGKCMHSEGFRDTVDGRMWYNYIPNGGDFKVSL